MRDTEAWEIESAIGESTAGILYLAGAEARPSLTAVARVAHAAGIPVLVDAAAELPPAHNLRRFIDEGADLVAFSGGKTLGGPTASGILCGRKDLIAAALLQQLDLDYVSDDWQPPARLIDRTALPGVPRHGIGRSCKVGKEQIVGLITALDRFLAEGDEARNARLARVIEAVHAALSALPQLQLQRTVDAGHGNLPLLDVRLAPPAARTAAGSTARTSRTAAPAIPLSTPQLAARLREAHPAVHVDSTRADRGVLTLVPTCLTPADATPIADAFRAALAR